MRHVHEEAASAGLPGLGSAPFVTKLWECVFQLAAHSSADASMRDNGVFPMALRLLHQASQRMALASRAAYSLALEFIVRLSADRRVMEAATAPESGPADRTDCEEARQVLKAYGTVMQVRLQLQHALCLDPELALEEFMAWYSLKPLWNGRLGFTMPFNGCVQPPTWPKRPRLQSV
ncbi:hypothetical protein WJX72_012345 [[Myrmecia] bisecta]|uniref:Uncharacterized protein n=1 Tax=[Myrmecia] bisecta TaxID=41462 RepID=A0AAW1QCK5_9CHLO